MERRPSHKPQRRSGNLRHRVQEQRLVRQRQLIEEAQRAKLGEMRAGIAFNFCNRRPCLKCCVRQDYPIDSREPQSAGRHSQAREPE